MLSRTSINVLLTVVGLSLFLSSNLRADLVLETETAELGKQGHFAFSAGVQFEREKDGGKAAFTLNQFEYAITDRAEMLVEPFFYEWNKPKDGPLVQGIGDLEITPSYMVLLEKPYVPAVVLAFKLKVPTATNRDIGTGQFDYQPYIILGKKFGHWILNANFGYDIVTSPSDEPLKSQFIYDFSIEREITDKWSVYAEVFANSSPATGQDGTFAAAIATEYRFTPYFNVFVSVGYDTDGLFNIRPGINLEF